MDFITDAVKALCTSDPSRRTLMYATIHLCTGVELLLKAWVMREHWALVFEKLDHANSASLSSAHLKSATQEQCIERLEAVGKPLSTEEQRVLRRLRDIRNQIIHFSADRLSEVDIRWVLWQALSGLMDSIENRSDSSLFSEDAAPWKLRNDLHTQSGYVKERRLAIGDRLRELGDDVFYCPSCGEQAVDLAGGYNKCLSCLDMFHYSDLMESHHTRVFGPNASWRHNVDYGSCPDCEGSAGRRWKESDRIFCFGCYATIEPQQLVVCEGCGEWRREDRPCLHHHWSDEEREALEAQIKELTLGTPSSRQQD